MKKYTFAIMMCITGAVVAQAEEPDTLKSKELDEVVVKGAAEHTSAVKTTYIPDTHVKNAATDAVNLLQRMAIPQLSIDPISQSVTTPAGRPVTIFINYVQASGEDIQGLKTSDVRMVEYLDYPTDPRFRNVPHAINIIVKEYEWGGYTKISDNHILTGLFSEKNGYANKGYLFSKFAYKKMIYDLYVSTDHVNTEDAAGSSSSSVYHLPSGDVERNTKWIGTDLKYIMVPVTLRASYNTQTMQIINTVGYTFNNPYKRHSSQSLNYGTDREYVAVTNTPSVSRSLQWNGNYYFMFPKNWSVGAYPSLTYGHNNRWKDYTIMDTEQAPIVTNAREDVLYGRLDLNVGKRVGQHHTFKLQANGAMSKNTVDYDGTSDFKSDFNHNFYGLGAAYTLSLDRVSVNTDAGFAAEYIKTDNIKYNDYYPYFHLSANWSPNNRNQFSIWAQYASNTPQQSERTPNIIQSNEMMYVMGNPDLKNARHVTLSGQYTYLPATWLSLSAYCTYFGMYDRSVDYYELYNNGTALLQTYRNDGDYNQLKAGANVSLRFLNNRLIFQIAPQFSHYSSGGYVTDNRNAFNCSVYGQYYLGDFNFTAYYASKDRWMNSNDCTWNTNRSFYNIQVGWSKKAWNISLVAMNFFRHKESSYSTVYKSPLYSYSNIGYDGNYNAAVGLTVVYTVGYGKPIKRGNEIQGLGGAGSAIVQ